MVGATARIKLLSDLVQCECEILEKQHGLRTDEYNDHPGGAILGIHDFARERELILEEIIKFDSGMVSSPAPRYGLIWLSALKALARRMMRGIRIKGESGACNALSRNQEACDDIAFVINRLEHGAEHCYKAIARLSGTMSALDAIDAADGGDAGAIMFAGALLAEHEARKSR